MSTTIQVSFKLDENGYLGRECEECHQYFKVKPGTGLSGNETSFCPYCGHEAASQSFLTEDQNELLKSHALRYVHGLIQGKLKEALPPREIRSGFLTIKITSKPGRPPALFEYEEQDIETHTHCDSCTLDYAIYGVFAYCPDCGAHNSFQTLRSNLGLLAKLLSIADRDPDLTESIVSTVLEKSVAAFDAFGREAVRVTSQRVKGQEVSCSFQNLSGAAKRLQVEFALDFEATVLRDVWVKLIRGFQKRHLFTHNMGVVDERYLEATKDDEAVVGRKVLLNAEEVQEFLSLLEQLGVGLWNALSNLNTMLL